MAWKLALGVVVLAVSGIAGAEPIKNMRILYSSEQPAATMAVFSMAKDGSDRTLHVPAAVRRRGEYEASVSPDGKRLAFTTYRYGGWKIATSDLDGGNVSRLTMDPQYVYDANWSPDGQQLVYRRIVNNGQAYFRGQGDIFIINRDGSANRNLTKDETEHARNPSFSPDGNSVVYDAFVGEQLHIGFVGSDGSDKRRLSLENDVHAFAPSWSPDGQWLAHMRQDSEGYTDLWVMRPDGSDARNLTSSRERGWPMIDNRIQHWHYGTSWSPDGEWIAFVADYQEPGNIDIYRTTVSNGETIRLTQRKGADAHPYWYHPPK